MANSKEEEFTLKENLHNINGRLEQSTTNILKNMIIKCGKKKRQKQRGAGHGGIDFFTIKSFLESVRDEVQPPLDVYDAAAWSAITPLSEASVASNGAPQLFPDFTRGKWMTNKTNFLDWNKIGN